MKKKRFFWFTELMWILRLGKASLCDKLGFKIVFFLIIYNLWWVILPVFMNFGTLLTENEPVHEWVL